MTTVPLPRRSPNGSIRSSSLPASALSTDCARIMQLATKHRLPAIYQPA